MKSYTLLIKWLITTMFGLIVIIPETKATLDDASQYDYIKITDNFFQDDIPAHEAWTELLRGVPEKANILIPNLVKRLIMESHYQEDNLYINITTQLLDKFPKSPEYTFACGLGYLQILNDPKSTANGKYFYKKPYHIRGLQLIWQAFLQAKQQKKKDLAAHCALALANNWLIDVEDIFSNRSLYRQLLEQRNLDKLPKRNYKDWYPWTKVDFTSFTTPDSSDMAKNDGELILWLLQECTTLKPELRQEAELAWANIVRRESSLAYIPIGGILPNAPHVKILKDLDDNQSLFIPSYGILPNESSPQTIPLVGRENYMKIFLNAYKQNPKNFALGFQLATEFWNRSQFDRAIGILKELEKNHAHFTEQEKTLLSDTLKTLSKPAIVLQTSYLDEPIIEAPNNSISIPIFYRNSPKETWTISRLNMEKLIQDEIENYNFNDPNNNLDEFKYDNLINPQLFLHSIQKNHKFILNYLDKPIPFTIEKKSDQPYIWELGKISVPISEPGYYIIKSSKRKKPQSFLVHYSPIAYFIKKTTTGFTMFFYSRKTGKPIEGITGTLHLLYKKAGKGIKTTFNVCSDTQGCCNITIDKSCQTSNDDNPLLIYTGIFHKGKESLVIPLSYKKIDVCDKIIPSKDNSSLFGAIIFNQPYYLNENEVKGKVFCGRPNIYRSSTKSLAGTKVKLIAKIDNKQIFEKIYTLNENGSFEFQFQSPKDIEKKRVSIDLFNISDSQEPSIITTNSSSTFHIGETDSNDFSYISWNPRTDDNTISFKNLSKLRIDETDQEKKNNFEILLSTKLSPRYPYLADDKTQIIHPIALKNQICNSQGEYNLPFVTPHYPKNDPLYLGYRDYSINIEYPYSEYVHRFLPGQYKGFTISALPQQNYGKIGEPFSVHWTAKNAANIDFPNVIGTIRLIDPNHRQKPIQSWKVDLGTTGTDKWKFTPTLAGAYLLESDWKHPNGQTTSYTLPIFIAGNTENPPFNSFKMIPEYPGYDPEQSINILITTAKESQYVWLFLNYDDSQETKQLIKTSNHQYIFTIPKELERQYPLSLLGVELNAKGPQFETVDINDPPANQCLTLSLKPDREVYRTKQKGHVTISVNQINGDPAPNTEVCLSIYSSHFDDSLPLKLQAKSPFQQIWCNYSDTSPSRPSNITNFNGKPKTSNKIVQYNAYYTHIKNSENPPDQPSFLYQKNVKHKVPLDLESFGTYQYGKDSRRPIADLTYPNRNIIYTDCRPKFNVDKRLCKPTLKWVGNVKTDDKGQVTIPFTLPSTPQEWTIKAWANTEKMQYGDSAIRIKVFRQNLKDEM